MPVVQRDVAELWWDPEGHGAPLLLLPPRGIGADAWYRVTPHLVADHLCIAMDPRGSGRTGVPPGPYAIETLAADAVAVLDDAGVRRAAVMGADLGACIAFELARSHPERVERLVVVGPLPPPADDAVHERLVARDPMLSVASPEGVALQVEGLAGWAGPAGRPLDPGLEVRYVGAEADVVALLLDGDPPPAVHGARAPIAPAPS